MHHYLPAWFAMLLALTALSQAPAAQPLVINLLPAPQEIPASPLKLGTHVTRDGHSFSLNSVCFLRDGEPFFPVMGEMQYARISRADWDDEILKMKNAGVNVIASYAFWLFHEETEGTYDWSGNRSLRDFLEACRSHGMMVLLRVGPWAHAELRNGGFPDWLLKDHGNVRTNDPLFLKSVDRYFGEMAAQMKGEYFKDGGPIIGVQIENEFPFEKEPATSYMYALKNLALSHGMDVPIYTEFAWPGGPPGQTDFLPMRGRYPDAPWSSLLKRLVRDEVYRFEPVKFDPLIGEDLFGQRTGDTGALQPFPIAMAELGSGLQVNHRRRVLLTGDDLVASAYVQVGCGTNMLGYYLFHGGMNPLGKRSTFQEAKDPSHISSGDVPMINYDFQAPLDMYGWARPSFYQYRAFHLFLNDFGQQLAPTTTLFPAHLNKDPLAIPPLRYCVRARGDSGFVFVNNYRRFLPTPEIQDVQFRINTSSGALDFPSKPCAVPHDSYFIWPFNLNMAGTTLRYSTTQPLCIVPSSDETLYVFSAVEGIAPEYGFEASSIEWVQADNQPTLEIVKNNADITVQVKGAGTSASFSLKTISGKKVRVLTLTRQQSLSASRVILGGRPRLLLATGPVICDDPSLRLEQKDSNHFTFAIYPDLSLTAGSGTPLVKFRDGLLTQYNATLPSKPAVSIAIHPETNTHAASNSTYQPNYTPVADATTWTLQIPPDALTNCHDLSISIHYTGDTAALYARERIVVDQFNYEGIFPISVRQLVGEKMLKLQIVPLKNPTEVYSDAASIVLNGGQASIEKVEVHPLFELSLQALKK